MGESRSGHHGDLLYVFEDAGFDSEPNDTTPKNFGSNTTVDTWEGSHEAVRVFNADRKAAQIIEQVFDGAWGVTCNLADAPWWLAAIFGQPESTSLAGNLYEHTYSLDNDNDPISLRLYAPTEGFANYEMIPGAVIASVSVDQSQPNNPELSITGAYAREPVEQSSPTITVPALSQRTFSNRRADLTVDGDGVGRAQSASINLEANTELVNEIGSASAVDFTPKTFAPGATHDKIVWLSQNVDNLQRFRDATQAAIVLGYDNGQTGDDEYAVDFEVQDSFPNGWNESGRNDPEADLMEELDEMGEDAEVTITVAEETPVGL